MTNYNPMSLFNNKILKFNETPTIQQKQKEYKEVYLRSERIKKEIKSMWKKRW